MKPSATKRLNRINIHNYVLDLSDERDGMEDYEYMIMYLRNLILKAQQNENRNSTALQIIIRIALEIVIANEEILANRYNIHWIQ